MMNRLTPIRAKAIVEFIPDDARTASGLYIAENIKQIPHRGKLIALGLPEVTPEGKEISLKISLNSIIHFKRQWQENKNIEGKQYLLIKQSDIICYEKDFEYEVTLQAIRDEAIVKRVYTGKIGNSSLILADVGGFRQNDEDFYGEVISTGPEEAYGIAKGERLLYQRNEGLKVSLPFDRNEYFSIKPRAMLAVLND